VEQSGLALGVSREQLRSFNLDVHRFTEVAQELGR
jgi:hypothetical protein